MSQDEKTFDGQCYCGARPRLSSPAIRVWAPAYCHCEYCRSWSAGPVNAFTLWKPEAVEVTQGADQIGEYHKNDRSYRQWCKVCGGHLLTRHPQCGTSSMSTQRRFPRFHLHLECTSTTRSTVLPHARMACPSSSDFPEELGGSGEALLNSARRSRLRALAGHPWNVCWESADTSCEPPSPRGSGRVVSRVPGPGRRRERRVASGKRADGVPRRSSPRPTTSGPAPSRRCCNFRVRNLEAMLAQLRAKGADVAEETPRK